MTHGDSQSSAGLTVAIWPLCDEAAPSTRQVLLQHHTKGATTGQLQRKLATVEKPSTKGATTAQLQRMQRKLATVEKPSTKGATTGQLQRMQRKLATVEKPSKVNFTVNIPTSNQKLPDIPKSQHKLDRLVVIDSHCHWDRYLEHKLMGCLGDNIKEVEAKILQPDSRIKPLVPRK